MSILNRLPFFLSILLLTSCNVYYKTAEVDKSIQSSLNQVNGNLNNTLNQLKKLQGSYASIPCSPETDPFLTANRLSGELALGQADLEELRKSVNDAYQTFRDKTKGKENISSGSPEWKQLKTTRKLVKTTFKELQKKGDKTIEKAVEFNAYINAQIVPKVQVCEPGIYISQIEKQLRDPTKLTSELNLRLSQYSQTIEGLETRFGTSHANEVASLKVELNNLRNISFQPAQVLKSAEEAIGAFKLSTTGIAQLYSCAPDWKLVTTLETAMQSATNEMNIIQTTMQQCMGRIQTIIESMPK